MEQRKESPEMRTLADEVIDALQELSFIRDEGIRIVFLESDKEKKSQGKIVYGECEKIPDKYKWAISADFSITFYTENVSGFTQNQMRILMEHELRHIGGRDGKFLMKPHDIEDFEVILKNHGMNWTTPESTPISASGEEQKTAAEKVARKRIRKETA